MVVKEVDSQVGGDVDGKGGGEDGGMMKVKV